MLEYDILRRLSETNYDDNVSGFGGDENETDVEEGIEEGEEEPELDEEDDDDLLELDEEDDDDGLGNSDE